MKDYLKNPCPCGKSHTVSIDDVVVGSGAVKRLPEFVKRYGSRPFVIADGNTWQAAGEAVSKALADIPYGSYIFPQKALEPDERAVGAAFMHLNQKSDVLIGVGSGVVNDICKIVSSATG